MFEFLLIKVGVGGLVPNVASIRVGGGVVAFGWMGSGAIASKVASRWVGNALNVVMVQLHWDEWAMLPQLHWAEWAEWDS